MPEQPTGTITFLFTDIEGSSRLWEDHTDTMATALARHDALLREAFEARGGHVFKTIGDAFCVAFGVAGDALESAVAGQRSLLGETWEGIGRIKVRMGLHTGSADQRDNDYFGPALNRVSRLLAAAHGGQVLLTLAAEELVRDHLPPSITLRDLGERRLRDLNRPERIFQLVAPDLPSEFPLLRSLDTFPNNLPVQLTSFIGREKEMEEVKRLLGTTHLLTLTGTGGTGKTRLSLQVAADLLDQFSDGVWLVELATVEDARLVAQAIAAALNLREEPEQPLPVTLGNYLRTKKLMLILDNCEHVIAECAQAGGGAAALLPGPADPGQQPRAARHRRGADLARAQPLAAGPLARGNPRPGCRGKTGAVRGGAAFRGPRDGGAAGVPGHQPERTFRGGDLPAAGWHSARHRTGGGPHPRAVASTRLRSAWTTSSGF